MEKVVALKISTTDGAEYELPDMCACCNMSTGGEHERHCPLFALAQKTKITYNDEK